MIIQFHHQVMAREVSGDRTPRTLSKECMMMRILLIRRLLSPSRMVTMILICRTTLALSSDDDSPLIKLQILKLLVIVC